MKSCIVEQPKRLCKKEGCDNPRLEKGRDRLCRHHRNVNHREYKKRLASNYIGELADEPFVLYTNQK